MQEIVGEGGLTEVGDIGDVDIDIKCSVLVLLD